VAEVAADIGHFRQYFVKPVFRSLAFKLIVQIRQHAAGNLILPHGRIDLTRHGKIKFIGQLLTHFLKVIRNGPEFFRINIRIINAVLKSHDHRFRCRLTGNGAERGKGRVDNVDARFNGLHIGHFTEAAGTMRVKLNGNGQMLLQHAHKIVRVIRGEQAGHILDTKGIDAHFLQFNGALRKTFQRMNGADRVNHSALNVNGLRIFSRFNGRFKVSRIVKRVEDSDNVDTVVDGTIHEFIHHIVGIVTIPENILPAEQHLQRRLFQILL